MENTATNRLSSAKWSRNLNEDSQIEANRLRLLERQRQILETKLQRRQNHDSSAIIASRPATSVAGVRGRVSQQQQPQSTSDVFQIDLAAPSYPSSSMIDDETMALDAFIPASSSSSTRVRARTSIASNRKLISLDATSSPSPQAVASPTKSSTTSAQALNLDRRANASNSTTTSIATSNATAVSGGGVVVGGAKQNDRSRSNGANLRDFRALSRSEANIAAKPKTGLEIVSPNPLTTVLTDDELLNFVSQPISPEVTLQCTIIRDKKGLDRTMFPTYFMHLQDIVINHPTAGAAEGIAYADQPQSTTTVFGGSTNATGNRGIATNSMSGSVDSLESIKSHDDDDDEVANVTNSKRSSKHQMSQPHKSKSMSDGLNSAQNATTTTTTTTNSIKNSGPQSNRKVFVLSGRKRKKAKTYLIGNNAFDISRERCLAKLKSNVLGTQFTAIRLQQNGVRYEIASISYETNVLGFRGPRKMGIIIPKIDEKTNVLCNLSLQEELRRNSRAITLLKNKTPIWNEETQSYVLNFHGRVTQASVKNFQLVVNDQQQQSSVGRPKTPGIPEMRRSGSSHQLRSPTNSNNNNNHNNDNQNNNDDDEDDEDEEEEEEEDSDEEQQQQQQTDYNGRNAAQFATTRPMSRAANVNKKNSSEESTKNSSITDRGDLQEIVSLQFGRVSNTQFSCDVSWPLSLLQAFAIALSSFDNKIACE